MSDLFCRGAGRSGSAIRCWPSANTCPNGKRKLGSSHAALLIADLLRITFPGLTFHDFSTRYNANFRSGTRRLARRLVLVPRGRPATCRRPHGIHAHAYGPGRTQPPAECRHHPANLRGRPRPCELGRASCRERVCQYVSISVVAVSLKKKK